MLRPNRRFYLLFFFLTIVVLTLISSAQTPKITRNDSRLTISTESVEIEFRKHRTGSVYLAKLIVPGEDNLLQAPPENIENWKISPLWIINFLDPELNLNSNGAKLKEWRISNQPDGHLITINWQYDHSASNTNYAVTMTVETKSNSPQTLWNLEFQSSNKSFMLNKVVFPLIGDIKLSGPDGNIKLAYPWSWGHVYHKAEEVKVGNTYPSSGCQSQFMAYYHDQNQSGLYISARDTAGYQKIFTNHVGTETIPYARSEVSLLTVQQKSRTWKSPYSSEVRPFVGDWYAASKIYREWLEEYPYYNRPNIENKDHWLYDTHLWFQTGPEKSPASNFNNTRRLQYIDSVNAFLGGNTAVHLYHWHEHGFDDLYPDYFPVRPGMADFMKRMKASDIRVVPYINGRITDQRLIATTPAFAQAVCKDDRFTERDYELTTYNGNQFATMCPATQIWQDTITTISQKLVQDHQFDGVYYDQIGNSAGFRCTALDHGHLPDWHTLGNYSAGTHWTQGYRKMLADITKLKTTNPDIMFFTEDAADPWNHYFDALLMYNSRSSDPENTYETVPMYSAIYGGYTTMIGFQYVGMPPNKWRNTLLSKMARAFVWGSQLGWIQPEPLFKDKPFLNYMKQLCDVRREASDYINFGEMKHPPIVRNQVERKSIDEIILLRGELTRISFPVEIIQSSYWEKDDNSAVVLLTNFSGQAFNNLSVTIELEDSGLEDGVYNVEGDFKGQTVLSTGKNNRQRLSISLPAYSAKMIELVMMK